MALSKLAPIYDHFLDYLVQKASPQEILAFHVSDEEQQRAETLTLRHKAGMLTESEHEELEQMLEFDLLLSALKAKALKALTRP
ncbi:MAG: hypothetical protein K8L91_30765 [Anaerolineae bacterium]|nr:hypothetical protein [Anaerolineae bacterium]